MGSALSIVLSQVVSFSSCVIILLICDHTPKGIEPTLLKEFVSQLTVLQTAFSEKRPGFFNIKGSMQKRREERVFLRRLKRREGERRTREYSGITSAVFLSSHF
jgi:hypothetical protein